MRVLVTGGRNYADRIRLYAELDSLHQSRPFECVIQGGARGADRLAYDWCASRLVCCRHFPADWSQGPKAGPMRNAQMLREGKPDIVLAFPGGAGTADMVAKARQAGVLVMEIPT